MAEAEMPWFNVMALPVIAIPPLMEVMALLIVSAPLLKILLSAWLVMPTTPKLPMVSAVASVNSTVFALAANVATALFTLFNRKFPVLPINSKCVAVKPAVCVTCPNEDNVISPFPEFIGEFKLRLPLFARLIAPVLVVMPVVA